MNHPTETARLLPVSDELTRKQRGVWIEQTREALGYSQRQLADLMRHASRDTLRAAEEGSETVSETKLSYIEDQLRKMQRADVLDEEMGVEDADERPAPTHLVRFSIEKHHVKLNFECPPEDLDETTEAAYRLAEQLGLTGDAET